MEEEGLVEEEEEEEQRLRLQLLSECVASHIARHSGSVRAYRSEVMERSSLWEGRHNGADRP